MEAARTSHSKIKTFRLQEDIILKLEREAGRLHISENMYVTHILTRALKEGPLIPALGRIALGSETFASLISTANLDSLEVDGLAFGKKNYSLLRDILESMDNQISFVEFLMGVLAEQGEWFKVEGNVSENSERTTLCATSMVRSGRIFSRVTSQALRKSRLLENYTLKSTVAY